MPFSRNTSSSLTESAGPVATEKLGPEVIRRPRASRLFVVLLVTVFVVELGIMWGLQQLPVLPPLTAALFDATLLATLVFPAVYLLCFRPFQAQVQARTLAEAELLHLNQSLEQRMAARTQELEVINKGLQRAIAAHLSTEKSLQQSLREQEALLKEVHHRVKNNLQVITSLLRLESARHAEPGTKSVLREMQGRIHSMALLHETLYRTGNFAAVNLADYLRQLATHHFHAQNSAPERVRLALDLSPTMVGLDEAIPCGLIVNELLTNALKHGFADGRSGVVQLTVGSAPDDRVRLQVADDGIGLPADFESSRQKSLGLQLVNDLTRQLRGSLEIDSVPSGVTFRLLFSPKPKSG